MISPDTALTFFLVSVVLGLTPGPDNVFVLFQSARYGRRAGLFVTLGLCTGLLVHTSAVALGLAAVLATSHFAFTVIKFAGALYLLVLAWKAYRAPVGLVQSDAPAVSSVRMFVRGFIMNLSNPKIGLFFLAFLPQFVRPDLGSVAVQIIALGGIFLIATCLVFGSFAWFADLLGPALQRSPQAQRVFNRVTAAVFLGLAARLALTEQ